MVENFRTDDVLKQESCINLQKGLDVGGDMELSVWKVKNQRVSVLWAKWGNKVAEGICGLGSYSEVNWSENCFTEERGYNDHKN